MRICTLLLLLLLSCCASYAGDKVKIEPEPSWPVKNQREPGKKPAEKEISDGYYLELSERQTNLALNAEYIHFIRKIVNETGVQNASEVSVTFSPEFQQVIFHMIAIKRDGKVVRNLSINQIKVVQEETEAGDFEYNGLKRAFVILKDVQKNDEIEASYTIKGFNPVFANKFATHAYFTTDTHINNFFKTIIVPKDRKLLIRPFNNAPVPEESDEGNFHIYKWNNPSMKNYEANNSAPAWYESNPYISITEFNNWEEVIKWGVELFHNYQFQLPQALQQKIAGWRTQAKGDNDAFASLAIRFVQDDIRYLGLEIGPHTHQPHYPSEVFTHRYGDCKDKALLLATILRQQNIEAYVALLNTQNRATLKDAAPAANEFDHAIVAIKRGTGYLYIDATSSMQRGILTDLFLPPYGYALVLNNKETDLQPVHSGNSNSATIIEKIDASDFDADSTRLHVYTMYKGGKADDMRSYFSGSSASEIESSYTGYYSKVYEGIHFSNDVETKDDSAKNEFVVNESYIIPKLWKKDDKGKIAFELFAKAIYEQVPNPSDASGDAPIGLGYPGTVNYTAILKMPEQWNFSYKELHLKRGSYTFDFIPELVGETITLRYSFTKLKDHVPVDEFAQYKADFKKIDDVWDIVFSYSANMVDKPTENRTPSNVSWSATWFSFFMLFGLSLLFKNLNRKSIADSYPANDTQIGGWVVVLGITLALGLILNVFNFFNNNYFSESTWSTITLSKGRAGQTALYAELGISLLMIAFSAACLFWFFMRRDIFPKMFIVYAVSLLVSDLLLAAVYTTIDSPASQQIPSYLVRHLLYAGIWGSYVTRSERVKNTFCRTA